MTTTDWGRPFADAGKLPELPRPGAAFPESYRGSAPTPRQLAHDAATDRIGEIMPRPIPAHLCGDDSPRLVYLRPPGGGCEWIARADNVQPVARP